MTTEDVPDLLNTYWRLVRDEIGDWAPLVARFAPVVNALQEGTLDQMGVQARELPFAPLLSALGLSLKGDPAAAIQALEAARPSLVGNAVLNEPITPEFSDEAIGQLRAQNRVAALATFLACCGGEGQAVRIFSDLERARRRRSLWETYLIARCLLAVDAPSDALQVALDGVNGLLDRRRRLDSGALRLNFGGRAGAATADDCRCRRSPNRCARRRETGSRTLSLRTRARSAARGDHSHVPGHRYPSSCG